MSISRLSLYTLIIGILTNSINAIPQFSRDYLSPVIDSTGTSNWYTTNSKTGTIADKTNKDAFTFIDSGESVRNTDTVEQRSTASQSVVFHDPDVTKDEHATATDDLHNSSRRHRLTTANRPGKPNGFIVQRNANGVLVEVTTPRDPARDIIRNPPPSDEDDESTMTTMMTTRARGSDIVFPEDSYEQPLTQMVPKCKSDAILCTEVDNYPENFIENIVKEEVYRFRDFFGTDQPVQTGNNITSRIGDSGYMDLCEPKPESIKPKLGINSQDEKKFIVNTANFVQNILIETCREPKSRCKFADHFPNSYEAVCEQKYIMRQLVSVTDRGKPAIDQFKIPSCCNCVVKQVTRRTGT